MGLRNALIASPQVGATTGRRQVMVGGTPFSPLYVCVLFLVVWLVGCLGIAARFFKWQ